MQLEERRFHAALRQSVREKLLFVLTDGEIGTLSAISRSAKADLRFRLVMVLLLFYLSLQIYFICLFKFLRKSRLIFFDVLPSVEARLEPDAEL